MIAKPAVAARLPDEYLDRHAFVIDGEVFYRPDNQAQIDYLGAQELNVFAYGNRGSGKSVTGRAHAHACSMAWPEFRYVLVRKSFPELTKNHLIYLKEECEKLGIGEKAYNKSDHIISYPHGSVGFYAQCASLEDVRKVVGMEAAMIVFDEAPELEWEWMRLIAASVRVKKTAPFKPMLRYLGNPVGPSIDDLWRYCIDKDVDPMADPMYDPRDWRAIRLKLEDNSHLDYDTYVKQFAGIPPHILKAWLHGERADEMAMFDFRPNDRETGRPYHVIPEMPEFNGTPIVRAIAS